MSAIRHRTFLHATSNQHIYLMCSCKVTPNHDGYIKDLGENPSVEDVQLAGSNHVFQSVGNDANADDDSVSLGAEETP